MQIRKDRKGITFKLTKYERGQLEAACSTVELIAKAVDGEPLGDAALKAVSGLEEVLELVKEVEKVEA